MTLKYRMGRVPCVIVAPLSCCRQWVSETKKFFQISTVFHPGVMTMIMLPNLRLNPGQRLRIELYMYRWDSGLKSD